MRRSAPVKLTVPKDEIIHLKCHVVRLCTVFSLLGEIHTRGS